MIKMIFFILAILLVAMQVSAQQYGMYHSCDARITFLSHNKYKDEVLPGTVITVSGYGQQLEIRTMMPPLTDNSEKIDSNLQEDDSERSDSSHHESTVSFDLKLIASPYKMQRNITSEKIYTTSGTLQLNNISRTVAIQYTPIPEDTENEGQMRLSVIATFNLSDFFADKYPDESVAFVISDGFVNRQ